MFTPASIVKPSQLLGGMYMISDWCKMWSPLYLACGTSSLVCLSSCVLSSLVANCCKMMKAFIDRCRARGKGYFPSGGEAEAEVYPPTLLVDLEAKSLPLRSNIALCLLAHWIRALVFQHHSLQLHVGTMGVIRYFQPRQIGISTSCHTVLEEWQRLNHSSDRRGNPCCTFRMATCAILGLRG